MVLDTAVYKTTCSCQVSRIPHHPIALQPSLASQLVTPAAAGAAAPDAAAAAAATAAAAAVPEARLPLSALGRPQNCADCRYLYEQPT